MVPALGSRLSAPFPLPPSAPLGKSAPPMRCCATSWREAARPLLAAVIVQGTSTRRGRRQCSQRFCVIVRQLLQHEPLTSRRALLGGLASLTSVLALGGCAGLDAAGARFDASSLSADPTLLVTTTRNRVNGGRAKPWFGPERASAMTVARAKLMPPDESRFSLAAAGLADWRLGAVEPVP